MRSRPIAAAIALSATMVVLAGCAGDPAPAESEGAELTGTLTIANYQFLEPGRGELIWDALSEYANENPGVTLEKQEITRADYLKTISTQLGAGGGPDIFIVPDASFASFASSDVLEPLDDVIPENEVANLRSNNDAYIQDGTRYSLLWNATPYTLFWNKKLTDEAGVEAPTSFEELLDNVVAVNEATGKTGFAVRASMAEGASSWWDDFPNWTYGFGGSFSEDGELTIDTPENAAGVEALRDMYTSGAFAVGDDASTYRSRFSAGELAYAIDNAAAVQAMIANSTVITADDIGSSLLPFPGGSSASSASSIAVNANSENKELAKDFMRWLFSEGPQAKLADALFPSAVGTGVTAPQSKIDASPWIEAFYEQLDNSQSVVIKGFEADTPAISDIVLTQVQRVLTTDVSAKEALKEAQKLAEALVG